MIRATNYEKLFTFIKVTAKILPVPFYGPAVFHHGCAFSRSALNLTLFQCKPQRNRAIIHHVATQKSHELLPNFRIRNIRFA